MTTPTLKRPRFLAVLGGVWIALSGGLGGAPAAETAKLPPAAPALVDFERDIQPLLQSRCQKCHGLDKQKSGLRLDGREAALRGSDDGPVIVLGKGGESRLIHLVAGLEPEKLMPKEGERLTTEQIGLLRAWIDQGANWPQTSNATSARSTHWSLQPLQRPPPPRSGKNPWPRNAIDQFVLAKLDAAGLKPSPEADRATLIRRLSFDLIGLPPTPQQVDRFVRDRSPDAYEKLVDRLLSLPQYGERWGRHWLDLVRYTESQGFEYDHMRANAWHYRDYVINSFNEDKPYDQFMREQIAGDALEPVTTDGMVATSLLVCGAWDQAGNSQANVAQRMTTREEEMEDLISVVGQSFLGLTLNCARCHSHKFDPIPQEDYFRIKAVFDGVRHGERVIATPAEVQSHEERIARLKAEVGSLEKQLAELDGAARARVLQQRKANRAGLATLSSLSARPTGGEGRGEVGVPANSAFRIPHSALEQRPIVSTPATNGPPAPISQWTFDDDARDSMGTLHGTLRGGARISGGRLILNGTDAFVETVPLTHDLREKTLEVWLTLSHLDQGGGGAITIEAQSGVPFDAIVFAEREPRKWMAGSEGFERSRNLEAPLEQSGSGEFIHLAIVYHADGNITVFRNGQPYAPSYKPGAALQTYKAGSAHVLFGKRHTGGGKPFLAAEIEEAALYDRALTPEQAAESCVNSGLCISTQELLASLSPEQRQKRTQWLAQLERTRAELKAVPPLAVSYVGVRKQPEPTRRLKRGDVRTPEEVVTPGGLSAIAVPACDFGLGADSPEVGRRKKFADWLADPHNPLPARVMANRIWQHHFGAGLVATPNDFGESGTRPSHPELLDWLAAVFTEPEPGSGVWGLTTRLPQIPEAKPWSLKHLHRLIVTSATYRQGSDFSAAAAKVDAENQLLWRFTPQRLEAEALRDAMLAVSGELNYVAGGPSFRPFDTKSFNATFYFPADKTGPEFNRRTVYRMNVNSGKDPMLEAFDCPDPSVKTPRRGVTTTPLQALGLMNNSFVQRQAQRLAERVQAETRGDEREAIRQAYRYCFGRVPSQDELREAHATSRASSLQNVCWALLNSTEFVYVR